MKTENILGMDTCSHIDLSVIVPAYNAADTIVECINSILNAGRTNIEIIIVDDGSTDSTGSICDGFAKCNHQVKVLHKQNGGVSVARNYGINYAHGDWITFVDADDTVTKDFILHIPDPLSELVCFNWQYTTGEKEDEHLDEGTFCGKEKELFLSKHLVDFVFRCPWAKFFKRRTISKNSIRFDVTERLGEDNLFVLDYLLYCDTITTVNQIGYIYLRPQQSKYYLPLEKSLSFITKFKSKYDALGVCCIPLLQLLNYYYFMKIGDESLKTRLQWEKCKAVREIQDICWETFSIKEKMKLLFKRFLIYFV